MTRHSSYHILRKAIEGHTPTAYESEPLQVSHLQDVITIRKFVMAILKDSQVPSEDAEIRAQSLQVLSKLAPLILKLIPLEQKLAALVPLTAADEVILSPNDQQILDHYVQRHPKPDAGV